MKKLLYLLDSPVQGNDKQTRHIAAYGIYKKIFKDLQQIQNHKR